MKRFAPYLIIALCLANVLWIRHLNSLYYLPPGDDAFHWLAHARALIDGASFPLWSEGLLQYPPAPLAILGLFARAFGDIAGLELFGALVLGILPLSVFALANRMFGARVGVVAALFVSVTPVFYEMWGFGMYPNLFGFSIMLLALFAMINLVERWSMKWGFTAASLSVLVMFSHHLTSMIFIGTLIIWGLFSYFKTHDALAMNGLCLFAVGAFVVYHLTIPSQYVMFNHNAGFVLAMSYDKFLWIFKNLAFFGVTAVCAAIGLYLAYKRKPVYSLLLISLIFSSVILTFGLPLVGIDLDPARFMIFSILGLAIAVAYLANEIIFKINATTNIFAAKNLKSMGVASVIIVLLAVNGYIGVGTSERVNAFCHATRGIVEPAGDIDIGEMVEWVKANTGETDVFVAEQYLSKILMGLDQRRVLESGDTAFLFMQGEGERSTAADSLLHANQEVYSGSVRVRDQYPVQNQNPVISLWQDGYYRDILYFADGFWQVTVTKNGLDYVVSPYAITASDCPSPMCVTYSTPDVLFKRDVSVEENGVRVIFSAYPVSSGTALKSMKINGWRPWNNNDIKDIQFDGSSFTLIDGRIDAQVVVTNPVRTECYLADQVYHQTGFWCTFLPDKGDITAELFIPYEQSGQKQAQAGIAEELINKYGVSYFAVMNVARDQLLFLDKNGYQKVFSNSVVSIYRADREGGIYAGGL
jgi:hypothetical protein